MAVRVYRSTDTSAPQLSGTVGTLVSVLDGVLVNGYGSQTAAGWTKSFSGTNQATYRQGTGSSQFYLHVNDAGPGTGTFKEARVWGSETASAVLTGTNLFPTLAQRPTNIFMRKSSTLDSVPRPWIIVADAHTFYMFVLTGDSLGVYLSWMFGDFYSFTPDDPYRCMIWARHVEDSTTLSNDAGDFHTASNSTLIGHYIVRNYSGEVGAVPSGKAGDFGLSGQAGAGALIGNLSFPNISDNHIYIASVNVFSNTSGNVARGRMRGFHHFCHVLGSVSNGDIIPGTRDLNGLSFLIIDQGANNGVFCMEISDTWETNT